MNRLVIRKFDLHMDCPLRIKILLMIIGKHKDSNHDELVAFKIGSCNTWA
jgi:hypothetical protein